MNLPKDKEKDALVEAGGQRSNKHCLSLKADYVANIPLPEL